MNTGELHVFHRLRNLKCKATARVAPNRYVSRIQGHRARATVQSTAGLTEDKLLGKTDVVVRVAMQLSCGAPSGTHPAGFYPSSFTHFQASFWYKAVRINSIDF